MKNNNVFPSRKRLLYVTVAAILGTGGSVAYAQQAQPQDNDDDELEEVVVTGSRIVRRDLETNSPLLTIEMQQFEDSAFISVEEALNDLPQFMAGGVGMSSGAVTSLQGANGLEGGLGSGDAFNSTLLPNNAQALGVVVPGAANVNLRGLGANRSLTLIDGHRAMPLNASMIVDLNTIPSIAMGGLEVITGGASAVYGADALAGVTNIKFRDNYEGLRLVAKGGRNEVGDGDEYQLGALFGARFGDGRGGVMIGMEYNKREESLWAERDFYREMMDSPYTNSGDYAFAWDPYYSSGATAGTYNTFQDAWNGGAPSQAAIAQVMAGNTCPGGTTACIASTTTGVPPAGNGWAFNPDGTIYTRSSQIVTGSGPSAVTTYYGPQGYNQGTVASPADPMEITCSFTTLGTSADPNFPGDSCNPRVDRVDYGKWLTLPRDSYSMFGRATFDITDTVETYANFHVASSSTFTRREPAPLLGGFGVIIPFDSQADGDQIYLPSLNPNTGATRPEYRTGGTKGTTCAATGGCTMSQAFPVPGELRTLLESRATANIGTTGANASNPFRGLSECNEYALATAPGPGVQTNPASGAMYSTQINPATGQPVYSCGPNAGWQLNQQPAWLPPRGTNNTANLFQIALGLRGDLGISDWTWDLYTSHGTSETQTNYVGFQSIRNYQKILSSPNYGKGYSETGPASKFFTCSSGLNPFDPNLQVSQDCIDAIIINPVDRNTMQQRIWEAGAQGHVLNLPAGEVRGSIGASYRWNAFEFQPDSLVDRHYVSDYSAGAFGSGDLDSQVSVREVYGELLVPLLSDLPFIESLELELGARYSEYSTGQEVDTYKVLGSWTPVDWVRIRGGYNRAERAPNMSELYATPNGSAQFGSIPNDPCRNNPNGATVSFPGPTAGSTLNNTDTTDPAFRAKLQALCSAHINAWGGNSSSEFHADPDSWNVGGGGALVVGNPELKNEQGDTWTLGAAFTSPFEHPLLESLTGTIDWYKARVTNPVELLQMTNIVNSCYNINGLNPNFELDDPKGYCSLIERDPGTGGITRAYIEYTNQGRLQISGVDVSARWNASLADLGFESLPGTLSLNTNMNFLLEQTQRYGVDFLGDYAGFGGASEFRSSTGATYAWDRHRLTLTWTFRKGTDSPTAFASTANADGTRSPFLTNNAKITGYDNSNMFNLTASTMVYDTSISFTISNLLDDDPSRGGYDIRDPRGGFGTVNPFDDSFGRRYSFNISKEF